MAAKRPVNLDLLHFRFPITALLSIGHRIAGVLMFLLLPLALWMLHQSLQSLETFNALWVGLHGCVVLKIMVWILLSATWFHVLAGIRHMCMDCGWAESFQAGCRTAGVVVLAFLIGCVVLGVWIW